MKALVIGYGSIGKKHFKILKSLNKFRSIKIHSSHKRHLRNNLKSIDDIVSYDPDYVVIANDTSKHLNYLIELDKSMSGKKFYVEKPIGLLPTNHIPKNNVVIGYNLRFHPIIKYLKSKIFKNISKLDCNSFIEIKCTSFLPNWRKNNKYKNIQSASKSRSGGLLYELSHELDYATYLFGNLTNKKSIFRNISNRYITTENFYFGVFKTKFFNNLNVTLSINDKFSERYIKFINEEISFKADFLTNTINFYKQRKFKRDFILEQDYLYKKPHIEFIDDNFNNFCKYDEGLKLIKLINNIYSKAETY